MRANMSRSDWWRILFLFSTAHVPMMKFCPRGKEEPYENSLNFCISVAAKIEGSSQVGQVSYTWYLRERLTTAKKKIGEDDCAPSYFLGTMVR